MKNSLTTAGVVAVVLVVATLTGTSPAVGSAEPDLSPGQATHVCSSHPQTGRATCLAMGVAGPSGDLVSSKTHPLSAAFTPAEIQDAYELTGLASGGRTVAIVDAFAYPQLESDLATYRSTYGLPPCTTANGCLTILNQRGGSKPPTNSGWDVEQALDVDAVSAACPDCKIVMVQADNNIWVNLGAAVNTAAAQPGVVAISNSYAGGDMGGLSAYDHPGIAITASTGDWGFQGAAYPASDEHVVAVSGTGLVRSSSERGYNEFAWNATGSGCSTIHVRPAWQRHAKTGCAGRAMGDVSAAGDPNNGGLSVYDSVSGGWLQIGGTSESSPIIAGVFALSGRTNGYPAKFLYRKPAKASLYDVTYGSNGSCGIPMCAARKGWDGVTGMGTPNGVKAF